MRRRSSSPPRAFQRFFQEEAAGGGILIACAVVAFVLANSQWADSYHAVWTTRASLSAAGYSLSLSLHDWINDGLMTVFFLLVGLEIKREILAGELSSARHAALPFAGALGGMVVPALLYLLVTGGGEAARGWGIPMATDIAFAIGVLTLVTPRIALGAKVFLTALAIVDDMGAIAVIALFYTYGLAWPMLAWGVGLLAGLAALNAAGVTKLWPYLSSGVVLWLLLHASGVHATIAGVLLAFTIPTRARINAVEFSEEARSLLDQFDATETGDYLVLTSRGQQEAIYALERASQAVNAPLLRLEHALHAFSAFFVMPLFALANAGVTLSGSVSWRLVSAVALGLVVGKPLGITAAAYSAVAAKAAKLPSNVSWPLLHGCAWLGGIGFTMSLFIATLAFEDRSTLLDSAKLGVLGGSVVAGILGSLVLRSMHRAYER